MCDAAEHADSLATEVKELRDLNSELLKENLHLRVGLPLEIFLLRIVPLTSSFSRILSGFSWDNPWLTLIQVSVIVSPWIPLGYHQISFSSLALWDDSPDTPTVSIRRRSLSCH